MRKLMLTIRKKRLKGNISLLIIFILLASSVIALLSINQIQRLLSYGSMTFNHFRSFYIAKAGIELGLTEVYSRGDGFRDSISSWSSIVKDNLVWVYSGFNPYFHMELESNFKNLTDDIRYTSTCEGNQIVLWPKEWIMLSLFIDKTTSRNNILDPEYRWSLVALSSEDIKNLRMTNIEPSSSNNFTFWIFSYDEYWNMTNINVKKGVTLTEFLENNLIEWNFRYLTIRNSWNNTVKFCVNMKWWKLIPSANSLITVKWNYWNTEIWLQSIVKKSTPSWTLDVLWNWDN